jgi:hypothetical protein
MFIGLESYKFCGLVQEAVNSSGNKNHGKLPSNELERVLKKKVVVSFSAQSRHCLHGLEKIHKTPVKIIMSRLGFKPGVSGIKS